MSSSVEQIKSKIDIVSLITSYMKLEKAGANYKGKCPFHHEKTPSFFVSPDRGNYYCFGCHAKGDIFTFVQEFEGLDFIGALKVLADKAGVTLEKYTKEEKTEKERLHSVLEQAVFFYQKKLSESSDAREYLKQRGLSSETIKNFRIGFAPLDWRLLYEFLLSKDVMVQDMLAVGLIKRKAKTVADGSPDPADAGFREGTTNSFYDTFRGRIMFPINDSAGRVVAFSGRILVDDGKSAKYLNSPETVLFNKSEILFGLDKAKKDIRLKDYSILVEGQMDLVLLHQVGITNTIASSGTALSAEHLVKLRRLSNRIIMAYDGDSAGFMASDRSAKLALSLGMDVKVARMPKGKDPADMAREDVYELKECLKGSKHIIDFYVDSLLGEGLSGRELGREVQKNVLPYVALLSSTIEKSHFIKNIAQKTFIKEDALWQDLKLVVTPHLQTELSSKKEEKSVRSDSIERRIIGIILWQKSLLHPILELSDMEKKFEDVLGQRANKLILEYEKDRESLLFETESYYIDSTNLSAEISELLLSLEEQQLKKNFAEVMVKLQTAEQLRDSALVLKYLEECQIISQQINRIHLKNNQK